MYSPLVEALRAQGWELQQMPCPELTFSGLHRFWAVREQYDTLAYRRHCARIAEAVASAVEAHTARGDEVVVVGLEGSPSLGIHITSSDPSRGGRPEWPDGAPELTAGMGILTEELLRALRERSLPAPRRIGIEHQLPGHDERVERDRLVTFLSA